jgi:aminopeptidase N
MIAIKTLLILLFLTCTYIAQAQGIDVLHYRYELTLSDKNDTIQGLAEIQFTVRNKSEFAVFELKTINADGKGMRLKGAHLSPEQAWDSLQVVKKGDYIYMKTGLFKDKDTVTAFINYKGIPADGLIISKNKFGDRTFFADNWPNRAHHWIPCIDRPDDKASFEFIVTAPSHYSVISNGIKMEEKELGDGTKKTHWKENTPQPTKVMVIGVAKFATKTFNDSPKDVPISALVYPQDSTKGFYDYALTPGIVKFFSNYIAPYPYKKLANVQSKTIFGGMENASAIFYAENTVTGDRSSEDLMAHEIAHQWFGDMASEKSFAHVWLSEGFATYFTNLYLENKYGKAAMINRLRKDREEVIAFAKTSTHAVVDSTKDLMSLLNTNSYQKGGWILHMLRAEVGDTTFQKIIQVYYDQYKGGNADTKDLEAVAEKVSGKELTWFFDQWLYQPGIPNLNLSWKYEDGNVELLHPANHDDFEYKLPVEFLFIYRNGRVEKHVLQLESHGHVLVKIPSKEKPLRVILDPDVKLLFEGKISEIKKSH